MFYKSLDKAVFNAITDVKVYKVLESAFDEVALGLAMELDKGEVESDWGQQGLYILGKLEYMSEMADSETIVNSIVLINSINEDLLFEMKEIDKTCVEETQRKLVKELVRAKKEENFENAILFDEPIDYTERDIIGF